MNEHRTANPDTRLYAEDCLVGMESRIDEESVSVVVTSPPYNIGVRYSSYADDRPLTEYLGWMERVSAGIARVLQPGGSLFVNLGSRLTDPWWAWTIAGQFGHELTLQNVILWVKSIAIDRADLGAQFPGSAGIAAGHFKPVGGNRLLHNCYEYIFHFTKTGHVPLDRLAVGVPYQDKSNVNRTGGGRDARCRGNTWFMPYKTIRSQRPHPAVFPVQLPERCIRLHGLEKTSMVLDPFMGSGTTAVAAQRLRVPCIGFDVDPDYILHANERLRDDLV